MVHAAASNCTLLKYMVIAIIMFHYHKYSGFSLSTCQTLKWCEYCSDRPLWHVGYCAVWQSWSYHPIHHYLSTACKRGYSLHSTTKKIIAASKGRTIRYPGGAVRKFFVFFKKHPRSGKERKKIHSRSGQEETKFTLQVAKNHHRGCIERKKSPPKVQRKKKIHLPIC